MTMTIAERNVGAVTIIDVTGGMKAGNPTHIGDKVRSLLQQGRKKMLINLAHVPYLDSVGLGELVQAYTTATNQGGTLKILNATARLKDLLVITKLATVFEMFDDEAKAVASFGA